MRVKVYFNLHKKLFSVVALSGPDKGRVIKHVPEIELSRPIFRVQNGGRERVLRENRKNVHAYIDGFETSLKKEYAKTLTTEVYYNPYTTSSFIYKDEPSSCLASLGGNANCGYEPHCKLVVEDFRGKIYVTSDASFETDWSTVGNNND